MFCNRFFSRKFESAWSILIKNIKEESKEKENLFKNTLNESKETYLFKSFKDIGNHLFKQNDYETCQLYYRLKFYFNFNKPKKKIYIYAKI